MPKKTFILLYLVLNTALYGQNEIDALRYSLSNNYNTAGISALGGAGGLLSHSYNPASLGFFGGNYLFSLSLGNNSESIKSNYLNKQITSNSSPNLIPFIQNAGYVTRLQFTEPKSDWSRFNFALSINRKQDFNKDFIISTYNSESSMVNAFIQNAQGIPSTELDQTEVNPYYPNEWLAYWTYLIDPIKNNETEVQEYYSDGIATIGQNQTKSISESGFINEVDIAFSSAYKDFVFFGASLVFTHIKFSHRSSYLENEFDENNELSSFSYNETLLQQGGGVNFKFGTIIKPVPFIRIGWSYHSPTYNELGEFYEASIQTNFNDGEEYKQTYSSSYDFTLQTPAKSITSVALIGNYKQLRTLFTFDFEIMDYGSSQLSTIEGYDVFYNANQNISNHYRNTNNIKLGLYVSRKNVSLRGGFAIFGSPFKSDELNNWMEEYMSCGLGYKLGNGYTIDLSFTRRHQNEDHILYQDYNLNSPSQSASIHRKTHTILVTGSYKF
tara:strand:+ start:439 stop:1932 length:1494 start_codon:yes stop_codon:yes gene_type:complete